MRIHVRRFLLVVLAAAAFTLGPHPAQPQVPIASAATDDAVLTWNKNASAAGTAACLDLPPGDPFHQSRLYAMTHIAIHDALNAIDRRSQPYVFDGHRQPGASPDAAVAAAARTVLVALISELPLELVTTSCIAAGLASVDTSYAAALGLIRNGQAKTQGIALGEAAGQAILANRANDGAVGPFLNFNCPTNTVPGQYQCTPGTPFIAFEAWANVTPFVLIDNKQFRPQPPYRLKSDKYAADYNEVKSLGGDGVTTPSQRTPDQTQIAYFWLENSPLKWNRIARTIAPGQRLDLWENARLFGLLNVALADGYIAMAATKNHYDFWRPITAIRNGDTDGNPDTVGDPNWTPLVQTPGDQDYASGHAIEGGAGAEVLREVFGTDRIPFQDCSTSLPARTCDDASPVLRSYSTFTQAADENAFSRILVGFHFRHSVEEGMKYGTHIGQRATNLFFRPVH
ncbi:MAG: vanadium-dependent haloperoxidase [Chloroflexi bacterium]|nr:vanadium-dependent haloperoxidase [Chloroflexota bacterium]